VSAEQNKALVSQFLKGLDERLSIISEVCAPQFMAHIPGSSQPIDQEGFRQFVSLFYFIFPDLCHTVEDQVAEGDKVVSRLTVQGTHQGPFQGMTPTGKHVRFTDIMISRIEDGKIIELWAQFDALGLLQQIGLLSALDFGVASTIQYFKKEGELMHDKKELCDSIRSLYPEIGECGIEVNVEFDEGKKVWAVDLKKDTHHLKTYLEPADANTCMEGKQCVSLGLQIAQLAANIKSV
jgi:predicted ester cyclase